MAVSEAKNEPQDFDPASELEKEMNKRGWTPEMKALALAEFKEAEARSKGCLVATAACGCADAPEVEILRDFRDRVLTRHRVGRTIIEWYLRVAPPIAAWIEPKQTARRLVRSGLIIPLAFILRRAVGVHSERPKTVHDRLPPG